MRMSDFRAIENIGNKLQIYASYEADHEQVLIMILDKLVERSLILENSIIELKRILDGGAGQV